jgi:methyl-accepting chemotaxis protein
MLVATLALGALLAAAIARRIANPLGSAVITARQVASGNLAMRIDVTGKDETGELMLSLKDMNDSLRRIVEQVRSGTDAIATASNQIALGSADLAGRTEEQASSLEQTVAAMEQMTANVGKNSDNARQASQLAAGASRIATDGGHAVAQVVDVMAAINEGSRRIAEIIGVIDGIAFQTNILALNAAVEAARAGEQGRGFAVVASEVRNLAQRSAGAAKEIKSLIDDSVLQVKEGSRLVENAGKTMTEVVASVKHVTHIISEISNASNEQNAGIGEINAAMVKMDEMTQQNASLVEEAAAATQSLKHQAQDLITLVSVFKLPSSAQRMHAPLLPG